MAKRQPPTHRQAGRIRDARGRLVTQLDPVIMHLLHRHEVIEPETLQEIAKQVGIGTTQVTRVMFWIVLFGVAFLAVLIPILSIMYVNGWINLFSFALSLAPPSSVWIAVAVFWFGTRNVRHQRIGTVMLRHLRCPHCGYDLRMLPADPADGATICPECGSAWRLDGTATTTGDHSA
jgi:hypothetical protein